MDEEELKKNKMEELQKQYLKQKEEQEKQLDAENRIQSMLRKLLNEDARARLNNVRLVNPGLHMKAVQAIMTLMQKGYLREKVSDEQVRQILLQLKDDKEISIKRK